MGAAGMPGFVPIETGIPAQVNFLLSHYFTHLELGLDVGEIGQVGPEILVMGREGLLHVFGRFEYQVTDRHERAVADALVDLGFDKTVGIYEPVDHRHVFGRVVVKIEFAGFGI